MNKNKKIDLTNFDFNDFRADALSPLKSGQSSYHPQDLCWVKMIQLTARKVLDDSK